MKNKQKLLEYLHSQNLMAIATFSDKPWQAFVYYVVDGELNLYFLSDPDTRHCKNISATPKVACAIADSGQKVTDKKIGVQIEGTASVVADIEKIKWVLDAWNKRNPGIENIINFDSMRKNVIKSKIYKVKPVLIKFFNEELYGPEGVKIFEF